MTEAFEAQQQAAEFILPAKYALNGVELARVTML
jgi:hypothetical protein